MMNREVISKNRKTATTLLLVILSIIMLALGSDHFINKTTSKTINLVTVPTMYLFSGVSEYISYLLNSISEIQELKEQLAESQNKVRELEKNHISIDKYKVMVEKEIKNFIRSKTLQTENNPANIISGLFSDENLDYKMEQANVISHGINNYFSTLIVDKGSMHGVKEGMSVIAFQDGIKGVVGTIVEAGLNQSKIKSLHKTGSDVGSVIDKLGYVGVTSGHDDITSLELNYIDKRARIKKGDKVYTLNNDSVFPPEILIGKISKVYPLDREFYQKAIVEPFIRVTRLHEVFVIKRENAQNLSE